MDAEGGADQVHRLGREEPTVERPWRPEHHDKWPVAPRRLTMLAQERRHRFERGVEIVIREVIEVHTDLIATVRRRCPLLMANSGDDGRHQGQRVRARRAPQIGDP